MERALGGIKFSIFLWNVQPPECFLFAMASSLSSCKLPSVLLFFNERIPLNSIGCLGWDIYPQTDPSRHLVGAFFQVHNNFRHCFKDENGTYIITLVRDIFRQVVFQKCIHTSQEWNKALSWFWFCLEKIF